MEHNGRRLARELGRLAIHQNTISVFINLVTEVLDSLAVHLHAPLFYQGIGGAATSDTAERNELVNAHRK